MNGVVKSRVGYRWLWAALTVLAFTLAVGFNTRQTYAGNADIRDEAGVLNSSAQSNLRSHVATLPFNVRIVTISSNDTQTRAGNEMNSLGSGLVLVVSPNGHVTTVQSRNIGLDRTQEDNIRNSANNNFKSSDWLGGFNTMLTQAGQVVVMPSTRSGSSSVPNPNNASRSSSGGGGFPIFGCLIIGLIALVAFSVFGFGRRRAVNNNYNNNPGPGYGAGGPGYGPGYGSGYGPGYGGGYGPGYNQGGGGMGALGGGAIGAGLGGVVGYELGKNAGRNEAGYNQGGGYVGNAGGGNYDNGAYTDPGASTGSWGDSSGNSSGGWDSGSSGSSSGSFDTGGSSDWGGGGGDSGGGGGGDSGSW